MVRADSKKNFRNFVNVIDRLGIWWVILTDLDFIHDGIKSLRGLVDDNDIKLAKKIASEVDRYVDDKTKDVNQTQKKETRKTIKKEKLKSLVKEREEIRGLLERLKEKGVLVLTNGELEDYFTEQTMELEDSKDRRALELALYLCEIEDESKLLEWFVDTGEFKKLLEAVKSKVGTT